MFALPSPDELLSGLCLLCVGLAALHGVHRLFLLGAWARHTPDHPPPIAEDLPFITVQLPLYNERDVAARLIARVAQLDWPRDRLEVQVLDDSTDDTRTIVDSAVAGARATGLKICAIHRDHRSGFKAGALAEALPSARGELIAIFDADFLPERDFLRRLVPWFSDPGIGMVQARWAHLNPEDSALTIAQKVLLDGHFVVEHAGRQALGCWFNFNGTAGLWRRRCVDESGGWQGDTLTEDLDLSYRAQLRGWRFRYDTTTLVPAELPSTLLAFQAQQQRWALGSIQVAKKLSRTILRAEVPLRVRAEAMAHLWASLAWLPALGLAILLPWAILFPPASRLFAVGAWAVVVCTMPGVVFYRAATGTFRGILTTIVLSLGMIPSQARVVTGGLTGMTRPFVRTPKRGSAGSPSYESRRQFSLPELVLALPLLAAAVVSLARGDVQTVPFLLIFGGGLLWVGSGGAQSPRTAVPEAAHSAHAGPFIHPISASNAGTRA